MKKPKPIQYTPSPAVERYIQHMLKIGLWGSTRAKVLARLFEDGIAQRFFGKGKL